MNSAIILFALAAGAGADARDQAAAASDLAKARELVRQMGDAKFKVRDAAERGLMHLGLAALDALKEGEKSSDFHIQERCRLLQPTIRSMTLQKRIDAFMSSLGESGGDLPFATEFLKITGDSKEARELYAEFLQSNSQLLDDAQRDRKKGAELFTAFCLDVQQRMRYRPGIDIRVQQRSITKADVVLFLVLATEFKDPKNQFNNYGYTFLNSPNLAEGLAKDAGSTPLRKIFLNWLEKEPQPYIVQRGLQIAMEAKMPEALPMVLKSIKNSSSPPYTRAQMMLMLTKMGDKKNLGDIEPLLADKTVVGNFGINNVQGQVQVRDVALAVSIKLSGQKMADYDFDVMKGNGNDDLLHMSYIYCAFSSDQKREAAHKKYKESVGQKKN